MLQETFLIQNRLIILYSFANVYQVMKMLLDIQSKYSTGEIEMKHLQLPTFDDIMREIRYK